MVYSLIALNNQAPIAVYPYSHHASQPGGFCCGPALLLAALSNGTNLQEFCSNCLCTIYSIAAQSLGNTSIPPNNETAGELYAELFGPNPELFYSSSMAACDPLVVSVLTAAGAFPTSSWRGVDTCMSLSASRGLLDFSHYGASCSLRENIQLKVAAASSGASILSTGYALLSLGLAALGSVMLGWI